MEDDERLRWHELTDEQWARLALLLPVDVWQGRRWADHRRVVNGVLHRVWAGCPWPDLPERYGPWKTVYHRYRRWSADGTWGRVLDALRVGCDQDEGADQRRPTRGDVRSEVGVVAHDRIIV